jgi:hypothetical protein
MTAQSPTNPVGYEVAGEVAVVRLAQPPVNALDLAAERAQIAA